MCLVNYHITFVTTPSLTLRLAPKYVATLEGAIQV